MIIRSSHLRCCMRKGILRNFANFTGKHLCQCLFFKKDTLAWVFSCEICKIFQNNFFTEHLRTTASRYWYPIYSKIHAFKQLLPKVVFNIFLGFFRWYLSVQGRPFEKKDKTKQKNILWLSQKTCHSVGWQNPNKSGFPVLWDCVSS